jgi:hypothetical protein
MNSCNQMACILQDTLGLVQHTGLYACAEITMVRASCHTRGRGMLNVQHSQHKPTEHTEHPRVHATHLPQGWQST